VLERQGESRAINRDEIKKEREREREKNRVRRKDGGDERSTGTRAEVGEKDPERGNQRQKDGRQRAVERRRRRRRRKREKRAH